jgi:hypothetical protein
MIICQAVIFVNVFWVDIVLMTDFLLLQPTVCIYVIKRSPLKNSPSKTNLTAIEVSIVIRTIGIRGESNIFSV